MYYFHVSIICNVLARILNVMFIHYFKIKADGKISPTNTWLSKDERRQWENAFDEKYIRPVVKVI